MILVGFLLFGAQLALWLCILAVLRYGAPNSLPGRVSAALI